MAWVTIENPLSLLVQHRLEVDQLKREASIDRIKVRFGVSSKTQCILICIFVPSIFFRWPFQMTK